jgi:hypothetical protein
LPDTVCNPETFAKNLPASFDGAADWGVILEALRSVTPHTKIAPMDIDCALEVNNAFIIVESKLPGVKVPTGQMITLSRLYNNLDATIIITNGKQDTSHVVVTVWPSVGFARSVGQLNNHSSWFVPRVHHQQVDLTRMQYLTLLASWYKYALALPRPKW